MERRTRYAEEGDFVTALCWGGAWPDDQGQAELPRRISHHFTALIFFSHKRLLFNLPATFLHIAVQPSRLPPTHNESAGSRHHHLLFKFHQGC